MGWVVYVCLCLFIVSSKLDTFSVIFIFESSCQQCIELFCLIKFPPMDEFSVSVPGEGVLTHLDISVLSCKYVSIICRKLLSVLGVSGQNFCPRVGK